MDKQVNYILEEVRLLAADNASLGERIDAMLKFYLAGLALAGISLVAAQHYAPAVAGPSEASLLIGLGLGLWGLFVFGSVIHMRLRRLEVKAHILGFRKMLLAKGYTAASYLTMEEVKNNLVLTDIHGLELVLINGLSGAGVGMFSAALLGRVLAFLPVDLRDGISGLAGLAAGGAAIYGLFQIHQRHIRQADQAILEAARHAKEVMDLERLRSSAT